jgi:2-methylfumaryl-CoA hydratase
MEHHQQHHSKSRHGHYFEDFTCGQILRHATPRTISAGDVALYNALFGPRFAVQSSDIFAHKIGYPCSPVDDLLVFHIVFGKSVPDISINAIANLGYAGCRFLAPVYCGDTLTAVSEIIGLKENSNGQSGVVYLRTQGFNQNGVIVLDYMRWVMVAKRLPAPTHANHIPSLITALSVESLGDTCPLIKSAHYDYTLSGSAATWHDYSIDEKIDHIDGMTVEEAEHQMATRLYQNTAKVHFNLFSQKDHRFGRRLIYGGHVISLARALSFNGLANAFHIAAINGGRHVAPLFAGATVFAWSHILDKASIEGRDDVGALRLRTIATADHPCTDFPTQNEGSSHPHIILDLDYWVLMPK